MSYYLDNKQEIYTIIKETVLNNLDKIDKYYDILNKTLEDFNNISPEYYYENFQINNETFKTFYSDDCNDGWYFKFVESDEDIDSTYGETEHIAFYSFYEEDIIELVKYTKQLIEDTKGEIK